MMGARKSVKTAITPVCFDTANYFSIWPYMREGYPFNVFIGARRMGKTYSALEGMVDQGRKFLFMRRTLKQLEYISDKNGKPSRMNPFEDININRGWSYGLVRTTENESLICPRTIDAEGKLLITGESIGNGIALAGISSVKGISGAAYSHLIYDEFIKEPIEKKLTKEGEAFFSLYDSLASNRELAGIEPLCAILLSNATDIYNPLFVSLHIVHIAERMCQQGVQHKYIPDRGLALHILEMSDELKSARRQTAIAKLTDGTEYGEMSIDNKFAYNDFSLIGYKPLKGYIPVCRINEFYVYSKKGSPEWYMTYARAHVAQSFNTKNMHDLLNLRRTYGMLIADKFPRGEITFESYQIKAEILEAIFGRI